MITTVQCSTIPNFQGRKLSRFGTKREFHGANFRGLLQSNYYVGVALAHVQYIRILYTQRAHCGLQNFAEKTFTDGSETAKVFRYTVLCSQLNNEPRILAPYLQYIASLTKWWLLEPYFATHRIHPRHNNYMRVREPAHLIHVHLHQYVPKHIYIADIYVREGGKQMYHNF